MKKIVRTDFQPGMRPLGPHCFELGHLVRETACYYIFNRNGAEGKIKKTNAHIEPCRNCRDFLRQEP